MKQKTRYTILSGEVVIHFTSDHVLASDRAALANELLELNNAESLPTDEFLTLHSLNVGTYKLIAEKYPTVGELSKASDEELLSVRGFGKKRLYFLKRALHKEGY